VAGSIVLKLIPSVIVGEQLSYVDLVNRLTDLECLAVLPRSGEKCAQFSSFERDSRYDAATDRYLDWGGNPDEDFVRKEGDKLILAEMEGPGANTFGTLYAATAYWYLAPNGSDPYPTVPVAQRKGYWTDPE
jgi:hypothetical protein